MTELAEVVIVDAVRTPIGRGHPEKGAFREVHPNALLGACYLALLERTAVDPWTVDDVVVGCAQQVGEQSLNPARNAWLQAGLPVTVPATSLDIACGSSQQSVNHATALVASGACEIVIAGGVEHMGRVSFAATREMRERYGTPHPQELLDRHPLRGQGLAAEDLATRYGLTRAELDAIAAASHERAARATERGAFAKETVAVVTPDGEVTTDQGIRPDTTPETLGGLPPAFTDDGLVTAGNSSQISDGAAAVLLMSRERADELGLEARARVLAQCTVGVDPVEMLTGPIPATRRLLRRAGMSIGEVDAIEVGEAFASVVGAWASELDPDMRRVNQRGGAIALGHPLGASGARLVTTLLSTMEDTGAETGLVTMCCAGGLGTGTMLWRV